jgi:hypothetical protein
MSIRVNENSDTRGLEEKLLAEFSGKDCGEFGAVEVVYWRNGMIRMGMDLMFEPESVVGLINLEELGRMEENGGGKKKIVVTQPMVIKGYEAGVWVLRVRFYFGMEEL